MEFTGYRCDECGRMKQEASHWWKLFRFEDGGIVQIAPWSNPMMGTGSMHLCGRECVIKALSKAMGEE